MTNLIYIHTTDLAANDTSATFVINNALSLAHAGAAVTLIVMNRSNENGQMLIRRKFGLTSWPDNLTVIAVRGKSHLWFYLRAGWYVRKTSTSSVILTRSHKALLYLMLWKNRRHKYFFETHDFFYDLSLRTDINPDKRRTKSGIEQKYFRRLDGLVCLNQEQKKLYNNYLQVPIGVFRTGAPRVERHGGVRKKRIVYVGSLNERLGIDRIVKLIPLLGKDVEWLIIGGKTHEEVTGFPRRFPEGVLPANVKITGWIDKNELAGYLHSAQVGLLPLHNTFFNQYLTVPLKLFDYFAFGIPVICSDFPCIRELVEDGSDGFLTDWQNLEKVANTIRNLLSDKELTSRISENVYRKAERFSWENRGRHLLEFLNNPDQRL